MPYRFRSDNYYPTVLINIIKPRPSINGGDLLVHHELKAVRSEYKPVEMSATGEVAQRKLTAFAIYEEIVPLPDKSHLVEIPQTGERLHINTVLTNQGRSTKAVTIECIEADNAD